MPSPGPSDGRNFGTLRNDALAPLVEAAFVRHWQKPLAAGRLSP